MTRPQHDSFQQASLLMPGDGATVTRHLPSLPQVVRAIANGRWSAVEHRLPPNCAGQPPHAHAQVDMIFYVFEGQPTFQLGEQTVRTDAGDWVLVNSGTVHAVFNATDEPARLLSLCIGGAPVEVLCQLDDMVRTLHC